eukprot:TRINITY_DN661_c3_g1_i1.p1 TRINITY_DN661_c3_g1~~TRINITY_DN661_c3_g1_i1.p1  ORF type:complete len:451 (+),score=114.72 TRINITY_DN661_c3_g1_i1:24-1355(+)
MASSTTQKEKIIFNKPQNRNKIIDIQSYSWIGWDMDHTIIRYKIKNFLIGIVNSIVHHLVHFSAFDPYLLQLLENFDYTFFQRGVILDRSNGNFIKFDDKKEIIKGYIGSSYELSQSEISQIYDHPLTKQIINSFDGDSNHRFWPIITFFDIPVAAILCFIIDKYYGTHKTFPPSDFIEFNFNHIYKSFCDSFTTSFEKSFWNQLKNNPEEFVYKQDITLRWLEQYRNSTKENKPKLFLLTNSPPDYADLLMNYCFGPNWTNLFDLVVTSASKPKFFKRIKKSIEFEYLDSNSIPRNIRYISNDILRINGLFRSGNIVDFEKLINPTGNSKICYFGDNLMCDIVSVKNYTKWDSFSIVEELEMFNQNSANTEITNTIIELLQPTNRFWDCWFLINQKNNNSNIVDRNEDTIERVSYYYALEQMNAIASSVSVEQFAMDHFNQI